MFQYAFEKCDIKFIREIFCNTKFYYVVPESEKDKEAFKSMDLPKWMKYIEHPVVEEAGKMPSHVYFIISG
jgi:hypothetical protein